jgi:hypothetical protein
MKSVKSVSALQRDALRNGSSVETLDKRVFNGANSKVSAASVKPTAKSIEKETPSQAPVVMSSIGIEQVEKMLSVQKTVLEANFKSMLAQAMIDSQRPVPVCEWVFDIDYGSNLEVRKIKAKAVEEKR